MVNVYGLKDKVSVLSELVTCDDCYGMALVPPISLQQTFSWN